jgi:aspartyl/asparaginyl beta-hydroxylase (cupin superfamily)
MLWQPITSNSLTNAAAAAVARGDGSTARDMLQELVAQGRADAEAYALLAAASLQLDDAAAAHAAADKAMSLQPRNLRAVLVKAQLLTGEGVLRAANYYNGLALEIAAGATSLPPDLAQGVARAREARASVQTNMLTLVQDELRAVGYSERRAHPRFSLALEVLTGRKQPYFQQPTRFYYPELPNLQFYPRETFPWLETLEAATEAMTGELETVLRDEAAFDPYLKHTPNVPSADYALIESMDWSTSFLMRNGEETPVAARCPQTMAALAAAPLCRVRARSPEAMFSQLKAGAHIRPHTGVTNTRLICHVPLIVPPDCHFRVGNEVRRWEKGKAWVFDDTIEHEARNNSDRTRVVLIFDIWRPELDEDERTLVATLLEAMDAYAPEPPGTAR